MDDVRREVFFVNFYNKIFTTLIFRQCYFSQKAKSPFYVEDIVQVSYYFKHPKEQTINAMGLRSRPQSWRT